MAALATCWMREISEAKEATMIGWRPAGLVGVGAVGEERQHVAPGEIRQLAKIRRPAIHGRVVEFEIARMHDQPGGRRDAQANAVRDAVAHVEKLHRKRPYVHGFASLNGVQLDALKHPTASELLFQQAARERRGVDGSVDVLHHVRDRAGVVFVPVRDDDAANDIHLIQNGPKIGDDVIDPQHIVLREHDARIDYQRVARARSLILDIHHVLADFPQSSQGNNFQFS
jgi:hypothetical protein